MTKLFKMTFVAAALSLAAGSVFAEQIAQPRTIDARIAKVNLGGVVNLQVKQGPVASLVILGERDDVAKVKVTRSADTLTIDTESRNWSFGNGRHKEIRAELTVPNFNELISHGVGSSTVQGFSGEAVNLSLDGAGSVTLAGQYRKVIAKLGGVGSMKLSNGTSDEVDLTLRGAGHIEIAGSSRLLRADLGGVGSLDAVRLQADSVNLDMSGLGGATVYAKSAANVKLSGLGSATIHGNPAQRNSQSSGMGSVTWH